jgi:DNA-binding CsgD family transcriptional regulator
VTEARSECCHSRSNNLATLRIFEGDLEAAAALVEESDTIANVTGAGRIMFARLTLAGFRGDEAAVSEQVEAGEAAAKTRGEGLMLTVGEHARAILYNGLGRYEAALTAAESGSARGEPCLSEWSMTELVGAAARRSRTDLAAVALQRLTDRTQAAGTEWALGIEARSCALLSESTRAEELYRQAVDRLGRCCVAPELARAHLLYGEWLRRGGRRIDAREQLRTAHDMLDAIGMEAFAERARRELLATGERARKRTDDTRGDLTAQEAQIAQLAREGHSNPEIGAQLFLSPRTVEWHLRKVFTKLDISSRKELDAALSKKTWDPQPV